LGGKLTQQGENRNAASRNKRCEIGLWNGGGTRKTASHLWAWHLNGKVCSAHGHESKLGGANEMRNIADQVKSIAYNNVKQLLQLFGLQITNISFCFVART